MPASRSCRRISTWHREHLVARGFKHCWCTASQHPARRNHRISSGFIESLKELPATMNAAAVQLQYAGNAGL